jgi:hypothetical protein
MVTHGDVMYGQTIGLNLGNAGIMPDKIHALGADVAGCILHAKASIVNTLYHGAAWHARCKKTGWHTSWQIFWPFSCNARAHVSLYKAHAKTRKAKIGTFRAYEK